MKNHLYSSFVVAGIVLAGMSSVSAGILLDDDFNNDDLATNPDTGGGFIFLDNGVNPGTGSVTESESQAKILDGSGSNTSGILSSAPFDLSDPTLSYTVTWKVAQWTSPGSGTTQRRAFFTLQTNDDWLFNGGADESRVILVIDELNNRANLQYQNRSSSANVNFTTGNFALAPTFEGDTDGFTVTLVLDASGYRFTTTGLATTDQVNLAGTWEALGTDFATVLGTDGPMHVGTYIQNNVTTGAILDIDRITLASGMATSQPFELEIARNAANLDFEWNSQSGKLYTLVTSEDLSTPISTWPPYFDGVTTYENIAASGTGTNTLVNVIPIGPRRFFAVIEE